MSQITPEDIFNGQEISFSEEKEHWNTYKLKDGSTLHVKLVLQCVKRLQKYNPDGTPVYMIQATNVIRIENVPKVFKIKPQTHPSPFEVKK